MVFAAVFIVAMLATMLLISVVRGTFSLLSDRPWWVYVLLAVGVAAVVNSL